jgi:hypothetical protein
MYAPNDPPKPRELVPDTKWLAEIGSPSPMTVSRYEKDPILGFPKAVVIKGRKYRWRDEIEAFKARMVAMTESGESRTTNPRTKATEASHRTSAARKSAKQPETFLRG